MISSLHVISVNVEGHNIFQLLEIHRLRCNNRLIGKTNNFITNIDVAYLMAPFDFVALLRIYIFKPSLNLSRWYQPMAPDLCLNTEKNTIMKLTFCLLLLSIPFIAFPQGEVFKGEHFIEVTGIASQEIEPNEIYLMVRLREFEENRTKTQLEKIESDFFAALKAAEIDKKRLELADIGSKLNSIGRRDKDAFREKIYQLKLTSAAELEKFIEKLENVKVENAWIARITHSDLEKIKVELKIKALQAAKNKADYLMKAIGSEVGKPLMVRDWDVFEPPNPYGAAVSNVQTYRMSQESMDQMSGGEPAVGFKKIKLQAHITAQFEIK